MNCPRSTSTRFEGRRNPPHASQTQGRAAPTVRNCSHSGGLAAIYATLIWARGAKKCLEFSSAPRRSLIAGSMLVEVPLTGLSFSLTPDFSGVTQHWQDCFSSNNRSSFEPRIGRTPVPLKVHREHHQNVPLCLATGIYSVRHHPDADLTDFHRAGTTAGNGRQTRGTRSPHRC